MNWRKKKRIMRILRKRGIEGHIGVFDARVDAWEVVLGHGMGILIDQTLVMHLDHHWIEDGWNARHMADSLSERYWRRVDEVNSRLF